MLLLESGFQSSVTAEEDRISDRKGLSDTTSSARCMKQAADERAAGKQVLVTRMNKNKKFQKEKLTAEGYTDFVEFFNK